MFEIPDDRLPPGFVDTVQDPPEEPARPRPAATVVLLRDGPAGHGLEVLLMRRHRRSGFVPGAWVFPGGRVDPADGEPELHARVTGLPDGPPGASFRAAALRELFEETGVLLARDPDGEWLEAAGVDDGIEALRMQLMDDACTLLDVVERLDAVLDARSMTHIAHWVTPVVEPRRYDTHFFAAALPADRDVRVDPREMTESRWLGPAGALERFEAGELPMVFPTVKTLESLAGYDSVDAALADLRVRTVRRILPRLVRTEAGVAIVVDD